MDKVVLDIKKGLKFNTILKRHPYMDKDSLGGIFKLFNDKSDGVRTWKRN